MERMSYQLLINKVVKMNNRVCYLNKEILKLENNNKLSICYKIEFNDNGNVVENINNFKDVSFVGDFLIKASIEESGYHTSLTKQFDVEVRNIKIEIKAGKDAINKALKKLYEKYKRR